MVVEVADMSFLIIMQVTKEKFSEEIEGKEMKYKDFGGQ